MSEQEERSPKMESKEFYRRQVLVSKAFRPAAPVDDESLFAGRTTQMVRLIDAVEQPGQHAAVYGGRGVGKTSLAKVMVKTLNASKTPIISLHYTCSPTDTFDSIWRSVFEDLLVTLRTPGFGFAGQSTSAEVPSTQILGDLNGDISVDFVRRALFTLTPTAPLAIFIDEFDLLANDEKVGFAGTTKVLSDQLVPATLVLVGVADDIDGLVEAHQSVRRSLAQIYMPNMSLEELAEIVQKGAARAEMAVDPAFMNDVVELAQGLPNYVHLIAQNACRVALDESRTEVWREDLDPAITRSIESVQQSVLDTYHRATSSNRETLYKEVLLACALAKRDEKGTFGAGDVRDELHRITGTFRDLPAFAQHMNDFSGEGRRGGVLDKIGATYRYRYRFHDPLLQPYVLMRGQIDGLLPSAGTGRPDDASEPEQLF
jgi:Cdc6-like AAA superfamily ATPase